MGYNIHIGNAVLDKVPTAAEVIQGWDGELICRFHVEGVRLDNAPADGSPTDYTNSRWPSHTGWANFCDDLGLRDLFLSENYGIMRRHPGCFVLTPEHLAIIKAAEPAVGHEQRGRWEWLAFWVEWALINCETPAICNS